MTEYALVIPTTKEKLPWLTRTIFGFVSQSHPPSQILVGLDIKPWDPDPIIPDLGPGVHVVPFRPARAFKRQHEIINALVTRISGLMVIVDDDYWLLETECMSSMLAGAGDGKVVVPQAVLHSDEAFPDTAPFIEGSAIHYGVSWSGREVKVIDDGHGHNPFSGHPKAMMSKDFDAMGGFDWRSFAHYWWCDTDMWYRSRGRLELVQAEVPALHLAHPKYKTELFQQQNSKAFLARHREHLMPVHEAMLSSVIK